MTAVAWALAIFIRYDFPLTPEMQIIFLQVLPIIVIVQGMVMWQNGLCRRIWRLTSMPDLVAILRAVTIGTLSIALILFLFNRFEGIPRSSLLLYPFFLTFLLGTPRLLFRLLHEQSLTFLLNTQNNQRVLVLGAGTSGDMLVRDMARSPNCGYMAVGFLDDEPQLQGGKVQGVPVLGKIDELNKIVQSLQIDIILISMPSATDEQMRRVVEICESCDVPFRTLPKLDNIVSGQVDLSFLREVSIDDLLGRDKVELDWNIIQTGLNNKVVMVSGGGGSIGAELCRQIARLQPAALIIFERSEFNLYQVEMQLLQNFQELNLYSYLGDITDRIAVQHVLARHAPEVIFHAAAYKHVPLLQSQIREAACNNVLGTKILAQAADAQHCQTFIMISTDKAVNPTSTMGATKRAAEIFCQAMNFHSKTKFITVRFGNVLGSAGSVVPLFKNQIAKGGPVTVTHPDINRYFMTIPESCQLILQAAAMGNGGEIFVLDMGKPVNIKYLAEQMIKLSGKMPNQDIKIVYTGLRAGEKLHEELFHSEEKMVKTTHAKILLAQHRRNDWTVLNDALARLESACQHYDEQAMKNILKELVPEWQSVSPQNENFLEMSDCDRL